MYRNQLKKIEKMLSQTSTLTQNYKKVLMASMEHGDLETALYLRSLMELSVRSRDVSIPGDSEPLFRKRSTTNPF